MIRQACGQMLMPSTVTNPPCIACVPLNTWYTSVETFAGAFLYGVYEWWRDGISMCTVDRNNFACIHLRWIPMTPILSF